MPISPTLAFKKLAFSLLAGDKPGNRSRSLSAVMILLCHVSRACDNVIAYVMNEGADSGTLFSIVPVLGLEHHIE